MKPRVEWDAQEVETIVATAEPKSPASTEHLMEAICDPDDIGAALDRVVRDKEERPALMVLASNNCRTFSKRAGRRSKINYCRGATSRNRSVGWRIRTPDGGTRNLGIPTVIDGVIQQAILLELQPLWDPTFSEHSYGFRPGRSAHQAVAQAQAYIIEGYRLVVDIELAKFLDRVNHDRLMAAVAVRVTDRRLLRLIRNYLTAGALDDGLVEDRREGTPQGGPLSPLLSNLVLDELDRELERAATGSCVRG